jgi:multiple sugar transport system permease protein
MIKANENNYILKLFLIFSFVPLVVLTLGWLYFIKYNSIIVGSINNEFGINIYNILIQNNYFYIVFVAILSSIQWIGLNGLIVYYYIKSIPQTIYDMAKIDGLQGFSLFKKVMLPLTKQIIGLSGVVIIVTSFRIFEVSYVYEKIGASGINLLTIWYRSFLSGDKGANGMASALILCLIMLFGGCFFLSKKILIRLNN